MPSVISQIQHAWAFVLTCALCCTAFTCFKFSRGLISPFVFLSESCLALQIVEIARSAWIPRVCPWWTSKRCPKNLCMAHLSMTTFRRMSTPYTTLALVTPWLWLLTVVQMLSWPSSILSMPFASAQFVVRMGNFSVLNGGTSFTLTFPSPSARAPHLFFSTAWLMPSNGC